LIPTSENPTDFTPQRIHSPTVVQHLRKILTSIFRHRNLKIAGYLVILFSIYLFIVEISAFINLPTRNDERFELIELIKYKEDTLSRFYLWILLFLGGIGLIRKNFLGWIIPQFFITFGYLFFILLGIFGGLKQNLIVLITAIIFTLITILLIRFFLKKKIKLYFDVKDSRVKLYYLIIIMLIGIFSIIEYYSFYIFE